MKVYEVYYSDYDEHRTYFICSTRQKAEEAVDLFYKEHSNRQELSIHEWTLDDLSNYITKAKPPC